MLKGRVRGIDNDYNIESISNNDNNDYQGAIDILILVNKCVNLHIHPYIIYK
jgi:hypothetical protein